jgi:hypothetical protein
MSAQGKFAFKAAAYLLLLAMIVIAPHCTKPAAILGAGILIATAWVLGAIAFYLEMRK